MNEEWRDIPDCPNYQASSIGRVRSLDRNVPNGTGRILSPALDRYGYLKLALSLRKLKKYKTVHRLIAEAFIPNPTNLPSINHKNCIKTDNRPENLEWISNQENISHARRNGRYVGADLFKSKAYSGEKAVHAKLTNEQIKEIRREYLTEDSSTRSIAKKYKVHHSTVWHIVTGKTWLGISLLLLLVTLGCRKDRAPAIEICIHDGAGALCDIPNQGQVYKLPSELENYWMTNQNDMAKFSSWCFDTSEDRSKKEINKLREQILGEEPAK